MAITGADFKAEAVILSNQVDSSLVSAKDAAKAVENILGQFHLAVDPKASDYNEIAGIYKELVAKVPVSEDHERGVTQWLKDLRGTSETFTKAAPPSSDTPEGQAAWKELESNANIANLPYTGKLELHGKQVDSQNLNARLSDNDFHTGKPGLTETVSNNLAFAVSGKFGPAGAIHNDGNPKNGEIIDKKSGLVANIVVDHETKRVNVVFGGTTSGLVKTDNFNERSKGNFLTTLSHWVSNIKNALGITPHSIKQAATLTQSVVDTVASSPALKGYEVVTLGHSKGASESTYSALNTDPPLRSINFSSADLHGNLVRQLPRANVDKATDLVQNTHIKGDTVPNVRYAAPGLRPLGTEVVLPASAEGKTSLLGRHDQFAAHVTQNPNLQPLSV